MTNAYNEFRKGYAKQLEYDLRQLLERQGGRSTEAIDLLVAEGLEGSAYPFELIVSDIGELLEQEEIAGGEDAHYPLWSVRTATAIRILRSERLKVRRESLYNASEEAKAEARAAENRRKMLTGT